MLQLVHCVVQNQLDDWCVSAKQAGLLESWTKSGKSKHELVETVIELASSTSAEALGEPLGFLCELGVRGDSNNTRCSSAQSATDLQLLHCAEAVALVLFVRR